MATKRSNRQPRNINLNRVIDILHHMFDRGAIMKEDRQIVLVGTDMTTNRATMNWMYYRGLIEPSDVSIRSGPYVISKKGVALLQIVKSPSLQ